ncbi:MAG: response regulator [Mucilaginibacter sp.]
MKIKIAIADDHELIMQGLSLMLQDHPAAEVIWKNKGPLNLLENLQIYAPDVLLLDIQMPVSNGIDVCRDLIKEMPALKIIALTNFDENYYVKQMLRNGARGYLLKNTDQETLIKAIETVCNGQIFLDPQMQHVLLEQLSKSRSDKQAVKLTRRENEILQLIAQERSNQEIADLLFISLRTVETHRLNLTQKLSAKNTVSLVKEALSRGLI